MGGNFVNQQKENCMKNNIFKIIIFFLALVSLGACDDGCEDYLDQLSLFSILKIMESSMLLFMIQAMKPVVNSPLLGPDIIQRNIQQLMFLF